MSRVPADRDRPASRGTGGSIDAAPASPGFIADPYPVYVRLRDEAPVHWSDHWGVWVVSRYEDVAAILRDPVRFSSSGRFNALLELLPPDEAALLGPIARFGRGAFNVDPPAHTGLRRILRDAFGPPVIATLRPRVEALVAELLDRADARGTLDVVRDLALPLPVAMVCELLGAADDERDGFEAWAEAVLAFLALGSVDAERARRAAAAFEALADRFGDLLASRSRAPRDDLLSQIAAAADAGSIAAEDAPLIAAELMIAGHHTTKDLIANAVVVLSREPAARAALLADSALWPGAVEEVLRFESSIQRGWRRVTEDVDLHGHRLRNGELVFLMLGAANRDPAAFPHPNRFDSRRSPNRHLAFGYGIHLCIGAPLARLEASIALAELYRRHPDPTLVAAKVDWYPSIHIRGPRTLAVDLGQRRRRI
ncbi:MAG: cytochrome P450 [Chloroflexi bacterium]|nr:cytochrome P450 [Chloroflexota bacterium]